MAYNKRDFFYHKAKKENYAARSIYKLEEIDQRYRVVKPRGMVLDLGASPGSWSQYLSEHVGPEGKVLGVDLLPIQITLPNVKFIQADLRDLNLDVVFAEQGFGPKFDGVFSDMAPKTTGIKITDQVRSFELCELAVSVGVRFLKRNAPFVMKFFHSDEYKKLELLMKPHFERVTALRPESTRKESKEIFLIGLGFKG